jgi:predicted nucleic acid-binding protein
MQDKVFVDTNLWIYLHTTDTPKKRAVEALLKKQFENVVISAQVLNECFNTLTRKHIASVSDAQNIVNNIAENYTVIPLTKNITGSAMDIFMHYRFSFYDCLIIAAALSSDCRIVYSEDMQHEQLIENRLTIINPFS